MIEAGDELYTVCGATVTVGTLTTYDVQLTINGMYFSASCLKELRKFLKKLQRQLEQAETPKEVPLSQRDDTW